MRPQSSSKSRRLVDGAEATSKGSGGGVRSARGAGTVLIVDADPLLSIHHQAGGDEPRCQ